VALDQDLISRARRAAGAGDHSWSELIGAYEQAVERKLDEYSRQCERRLRSYVLQLVFIELKKLSEAECRRADRYCVRSAELHRQSNDLNRRIDDWIGAPEVWY
jgi:hypothetical protein